MNNLLNIGKFEFTSRFMLGTGKYPSVKIAKEAIESSKAEIVTVAIRRIKYKSHNYSQESQLLKALDWRKLFLLPNTAGCQTAEEAIRVAFLGRELCSSLGQVSNNLIKLEVISDGKYLFPDPIGTLKAAKFLVNEGFSVLPYINGDPILAKHLEEIGCAAVMPLAAPIGSGQGLQNLENLKIIIEQSNVPVIIDAGIGVPSDACKAMEVGAQAILLNTAVAKSSDPVKMAVSFSKAIESGYEAFHARRVLTTEKANPSSPVYDLK